MSTTPRVTPIHQNDVSGVRQIIEDLLAKGATGFVIYVEIEDGVRLLTRGEIDWATLASATALIEHEMHRLLATEVEPIDPADDRPEGTP